MDTQGSKAEDFFFDVANRNGCSVCSGFRLITVHHHVYVLVSDVVFRPRRWAPRLHTIRKLLFIFIFIFIFIFGGGPEEKKKKDRPKALLRNTA